MKNNYFQFSKKERTAILILLLMNLILFALPHLQCLSGVNQTNSVISSVEIDSIFPKLPLSVFPAQNQNKFLTKDSSFAQNLFEFDPNTLSKKGWIMLGVPERTASSIEKFLLKGGQFKKSEDLLKIYTLSKPLAWKLIPWVRLHAKGSASETDYVVKNFVSNNQISQHKDKKIELDVNVADSSAWTKLPGIGAGFAKRIIKFREKLGGFVTIDQIRETYGLPDSTFQKIRPMLVLKNGKVKTIDLNTATKEDFQSHPYLRWAGAKALILYRDSHGSFKTKEELLQIPFFGDSVFQKISPYLQIEMEH